MRDIPTTCHECLQPIVTVKSVILYCNCLAALCIQCAYKHLAMKTSAPYAQYIACPNCKGVLSEQLQVDAQEMMSSIDAARNAEEVILEKAVRHFKMGEYSNLVRRDPHNLTWLYLGLIRRYKSSREPILFDVDVEDKSEHFLRNCVLKADLHRTTALKKKQ